MISPQAFMHGVKLRARVLKLEVGAMIVRYTAAPVRNKKNNYVK